MRRFEKLQLIQAAIESAGELEKAEIDRIVAARMGVDPEQIRRSLYRDLNELVETGSILVRHFHMNGMEVDTDELPEHYYSKWSRLDGATSFPGSGWLGEFGVRVTAARRMLSALSGHQIWLPPDSNFVSLAFGLMGTKQMLRLQRSHLPVEFKILRLREKLPINDPLVKAVNQSGGKRVIWIELPIFELSSFKEGVRDCHVSLTFDGEANAMLVDHQTTNGSRYALVNKMRHADALSQFPVGTERPGRRHERVETCEIDKPSAFNFEGNALSILVADQLICVSY